MNGCVVLSQQLGYTTKIRNSALGLSGHILSVFITTDKHNWYLFRNTVYERKSLFVCISVCSVCCWSIFFIYSYSYVRKGKKVGFDIFFLVQILMRKKFAVISSLSASGILISSCNTLWPKGILSANKVIAQQKNQ